MQAATTARTLAADTIILPPPRQLKWQNPYSGYVSQRAQTPQINEADVPQYQPEEELEESDWHNMPTE